MVKQFSRPAIFFMAFIAIIAWFALALQLYIMTGNKLSNARELIAAISHYFSYFTILTNFLVAISLSTVLLWPSSSLGQFFSKPSTLAAIALYIFIVGLVYNVILRYTWNPAGAQKWADEGLHVVVPLLFVIFWLTFVPKRSLNWIHPFRWLVYPGGYLLYALLRGTLSGFYPYFFINAEELGYNRVLLNSGGLMIVFLIAGLIIVGTGKLMGRSKSRAFS
jgi:hypothetical protein